MNVEPLAKKGGLAASFARLLPRLTACSLLSCHLISLNPALAQTRVNNAPVFAPPTTAPATPRAALEHAGCDLWAKDAAPSEPAFNNLSFETAKDQLTTLMDQATARSAAVTAAKHQLQAAHFEIRQAKALPLPTVSVSSQVGVGQSQTGSNNPGPRPALGLGVQASAPLYDGGRNALTLQLREQLASANEQSLGAARERATLEALQLALERNRLRLALKVHQQHVDTVQCLREAVVTIVQFDPGRASELVQANKTLNQAKLSRDEVLTALRLAQIKLTQLLGDSANQTLLVQEALTRPKTLNEVAALVVNNPDLEVLRRQAEAAQLQVKLRAAEAQPAARWQLGVNSAHNPALPNVSTNSWNAILGVNYTVYDGGIVDASTAAAQSQADAALASYAQARRERLIQVEQTYETAVSQQEKIQQYQDLLKQSHQVRVATFEQWSKMGKRTLFDLISAENDHHQLQLAQLQSRYDAFQAHMLLRAYAPGLVGWISSGLQ